MYWSRNFLPPLGSVFGLDRTCHFVVEMLTLDIGTSHVLHIWSTLHPAYALVYLFNTAVESRASKQLRWEISIILQQGHRDI